MENKIVVTEYFLTYILSNLDKAGALIDIATQHLKNKHAESDSQITSFQAACILESADSILLDDVVAIRKELGMEEE